MRHLRTKGAFIVPDRRLHALHAGPGVLVLPNAWDVITARLFESAGFPAVATSSAAVANALGYADGRALPLDLHLATVARIVRGAHVPITVDMENGYADEPSAVAAAIAALAATGAAGYNLEDTKAPGELYSVDEQVARLRSARAAAPDLFLNARTDVFLEEIGPEADRFDEAAQRLRAFTDAGADGVFVPGVADPELIARLAAVTPLPLNVLAGPQLPDVAALERLGVRRVSVGSWPMRRTLGVLREIARELRKKGSFSFTRAPSVSYADSNALVTPGGNRTS
jgi:2-methylisocitrate lyase-like PEP mutase family enzyme